MRSGFGAYFRTVLMLREIKVIQSLSADVEAVPIFGLRM